MNILMFIVMIFGFQALYWFIGRRASKRANDKESYFLASKGVKFFPLMMTFLATQVGGGIILGSADEAYQFGWPVLLFPLGSALGLILLGSGVGRKLAGFKVSTVAQIFEVVYRSARLKKIASLLSVVSLFMILVGQIIGSHKFLVSMGIDNTPLFILFWAIVILYTVRGGLRSVIATDMVQALVFFGAFFLCFGFILYLDPSVSSIAFPQIESFVQVSSKWCGWILMPLLFMVIEQDMGQRCFAGISPRVVSRASFCAGICTMIICVIPIFFGIFGATRGIEIPPGASVLMTVIAKTTTPWITSLVGCAVLAAVISTVTSLINAIGSNLSNDFKEIRHMKIVRGMTYIIAIGAIFCAFHFDNIVGILIQSYELSVSCLFIPLSVGLFRKRGSALAAWLSILFGALSFFAFHLYPIAFPREVVSVALSLFGYGCGEMITHYQKRKVSKAA